MQLPLGVLFAVIAAVGLASQAVCVRVGTDAGKSTDAVLVGLATNVAITVPLAAALYYPRYHVTPLALASFASAGVLGSMFGRAFYFEGISRAGASRAEAVKSSQSLHAALLAALFVGQSLTLGHLAAILLIVAGLVLLASDSADDPLTGRSLSPRTLVFPLLAAFFFGLEPVLATVGFEAATPALVGVAVKTSAALLGYVGYRWWRTGLPGRETLDANTRWFLAAGVANTGFVVAYYSALAVAPVGVVVPIVQTSPLLIVAVSAFALREYERVTPRLVAAAITVFVGAVGVTLLG
ncbi:MAG: EamA family transporter [Halarchaeum sp.]